MEEVGVVRRAQPAACEFIANHGPVIPAKVAEVVVKSGPKFFAGGYGNHHPPDIGKGGEHGAKERRSIGHMLDHIEEQERINAEALLLGQIGGVLAKDQTIRATQTRPGLSEVHAGHVPAEVVQIAGNDAGAASYLEQACAPWQVRVDPPGDGAVAGNVPPGTLDAGRVCPGELVPVESCVGHSLFHAHAEFDLFEPSHPEAPQP